MNAPAAFPADPAPHDADTPAEAAIARARALALEQLAVLKRLAEAGMQVVLAVEGEAKAWTPPESEAAAAPEPAASCDDPPDPSLMARRGRGLQALAMAYARAARAVRLTLMLQSRVLRELEQVERQAEFNIPSPRQRQAARDQAAQARKLKIARIVRRMAEDEGADAETLEAVEACERLDEDAYGDVLTRPMGEIVAHLCRDLNLDPDWSRWAEEAWAEAEIASAAPGSPFAGLGAVQKSPPSPSMGEGPGMGVWPSTMQCLGQEAGQPHAPSPISSG